MSKDTECVYGCPGGTALFGHAADCPWILAGAPVPAPDNLPQWSGEWVKVPNPSVVDYPLPWSVGEEHETMARVIDATGRHVFTVNTPPFNHLAGKIAATLLAAVNAATEPA